MKTQKSKLKTQKIIILSLFQWNLRLKSRFHCLLRNREFIRRFRSIAVFGFCQPAKLRLAMLAGILMLGFLMVGGCARTVTPTAVGNQIVFSITFKGNVDSASNKYYVLLGTQSVRLPYGGAYFFGPGESYDANRFNIAESLDYYYQNYFSTWSDFIVLSNENFYITQSGGTSFGNSGSVHGNFQPQFLSARGTPADPKTMTFTVYFNRLSTIPSYLYFNFIAVDSISLIKDRLDREDNNIFTTPGTTVTGVDLEDSSLSSSQDIVSWSVTIQ